MFRMFRFMLYPVVALFFAASGLALAAEVKLTDSERGNTVVLTSAEKSGFLRYENSQFGYSVDIPASFSKIILLPDNGDGLILATQDDKSRFRASGGNYIEGIERTLKQSYDEAREGLPVKAAYATLKNDYWVLSWLEDEVIHYRKFMLRGDTWCDFELSYPAAQKKAYDSVVTHVAQSLTLNPQ